MTPGWWTIPLVLTAGVCCGDDGSPGAPAAPAPPAPGSPTDPAPGGPCRTGPRHELSTHPPGRSPTLVAGGEPDGATVVAGRGDRVRLHPVGVGGRPRTPASDHALAGAEGLLAVARLGGRLAVVVETSCEGRPCMRAYRFGPDGVLDGEPSAPTRHAPRTVRLAGDARSFVVARSHAAGGAEAPPPAVDQLLPAPDGTLRWARHTLGEERSLTDVPVEILRAAVAGDGWAVVWRAGAVEDAASDVLVSRSDGTEVAAEALHHALVVESIAVRPDGLDVIVGFEFSRPHFIALGLDGEPDSAPVEPPPGGSVPPPFAGWTRATLESDGRTLSLRVRDAAGDALGRPIEVAQSARRGRIPADVARVGDAAFVVAWAVEADDGWTVSTMSVRCTAR